MPLLQKTLPITDTRFRPSVGMDGAKHLLDLGEDEVIALIDEGLLTHAWNIGLGNDHREIRVLRYSIDLYKEWDRNRKSNSITGPADPKVHDLLLPPGHAKPFLTNGDLQRSLNCVSGHVLNLVEARELQLQPGTEYGRGPNGSALVTVASFKKFLTTRRLP